MTPEGIEPSTFGFGIRRATNYAMESLPRGTRPQLGQLSPKRHRWQKEKVLSGLEPELEDSESSVIAITL